MELLFMVFFISLVIIGSGVVFKKMRILYLTEPLLAMTFGILLGPDVFNLIESNDTAHEFKVLEKTCEFTMAMALMATALRLPKNFYRKNKVTQTNIVIFGMILMWLSSAGVLYWVLSGFSIAECLLLGAIITPTDPVVASTIVSGEKAEKFLPASVRNTISFESGSNDGMAFPIVLLSVFLVDSVEFPYNKWLTHTLLYETILCGILAYVVGLLAGKIMHRSHEAGYMNTRALLPFSLALSLLLLSGFNLLKMNGILAVFIGGLGFAKHITPNEDLKEERVQESMERIFLIPVFFIFGMMLPWEEWFSLGWTAILVILGILFLRRIPAFLILKPFLPKFRGKIYDILIIGWFGPIGVAALYYAILSKEKALFDEAWIIPSLIVFASTIVHGITGLPFERKYHQLSGRPKKEKSSKTSETGDQNDKKES